MNAEGIYCILTIPGIALIVLIFILYIMYELLYYGIHIWCLSSTSIRKVLRFMFHLLNFLEYQNANESSRRWEQEN